MARTRMAAKPTLPKPACPYGYTSAQIAEIMGPRLPQFRAWIAGATGMICEGRAACETAHGFVTYAHDVEAFLAGLPPLD